MRRDRQSVRQSLRQSGAPWHFVVSFVVHFVAISLPLPALAISPSPLATNSANPALERFGRSVIFYVSFDGHANAEITAGDPAPQGNTNWTAAAKPGAVPYVPGVYGQGVRSRDNQLTFTCTGAVLRSAGSLALWLTPESLAHAGTYFWPVMLHAGGGYSVMAGRMGDPRNGETLYAYLSNGNGGVSACAGSMGEWKTNSWHLLVATWDRNGLDFSVDGAATVHSSLKSPIAFDGAAGLRAILLCPSDDTFVYDEFLVLDVPLSKPEIQWLYEQGMERLSK